MATVQQWISGARPRTLPLSLAPILIACGAAYAYMTTTAVAPKDPQQSEARGSSAMNIGWAIDTEAISVALSAVLLSLCLQIGCNYANDYSDGMRGTDEHRVGPVRLTASGLAKPATVKRAAFISFGVAAVAGLSLVLVSGAWILLPIGVSAILAAWFYTGGKKPYGYYGLGEVFVFIFFGLVATLGTTYALIGTVTTSAMASAIGMGSFACGVLVANNLRDIPSDEAAGKRTLAVKLGDSQSRKFYITTCVVPYMCLIVPIVQGHVWTAIAILSAGFIIPQMRTVLRGATGADLIPTLKGTSMATLVYSFFLGLGLTL